MAGEIFKRASMPRKEVFDYIISEMIKAGWERLNEGHPTTGASRYIMFSPGVRGNTHMYIELLPYAGSDVIGNATYDIRTTTRSNGMCRGGSGYDPVTGNLVGPFQGMFAMCFHPGERYDYITAGYMNQVYPLETIVEVFTNITKDFVSWVYVPDKATTPFHLSSLFCWGIPEVEYLQESYEPSYSNVLWASSQHMYNSNSRNTVSMKDTPKALLRRTSSYYTDLSILLSPVCPNAEGVIELSDIYVVNANEGIRSRIGRGIYAVRGGGAADGDTIEVVEGDTTKKYRYVTLNAPVSGNSSMLPTNFCAIRIE